MPGPRGGRGKNAERNFILLPYPCWCQDYDSQASTPCAKWTGRGQQHGRGNSISLPCPCFDGQKQGGKSSARCLCQPSVQLLRGGDAGVDGVNEPASPAALPASQASLASTGITSVTTTQNGLNTAGVGRAVLHCKSEMQHFKRILSI